MGTTHFPAMVTTVIMVIGDSMVVVAISMVVVLLVVEALVVVLFVVVLFVVVIFVVVIIVVVEVSKVECKTNKTKATGEMETELLFVYSAKVHTHPIGVSRLRTLVLVAISSRGKIDALFV